MDFQQIHEPCRTNIYYSVSLSTPSYNSLKILLKKTLGVPGGLSQLSVRLLVSAQVAISQFVGLSPASGSMLTVWNLLGILSLPFSLCPSPACSLSLKINKL